MPPYLWALNDSSKQDVIKDEIHNIHCCLVTEELWKVFKKTVKRTRKRNESQVEDIVVLASERISELQRIDMKRGRNLESFQKANDYLREALQGLRTLENLSQAKLNTDLKDEARAVQLDQNAFDNAVQRAEQLRKYQRGQKIHFIEINESLNPSTKTLHETDNGYFSYQDLAWYLVRAKVVTAPDLWIKRDSSNKIPESSVQWVYQWGSNSIESNEIYVISTKGRNDYIVAVVHEGDEENPVVLNVPKCGEPGEFPCCDPPCKYLEQHLDRIWPNHLVEHAVRFSKPDDKGTLAMRFDLSTFDHRTNDLKSVKRYPEFQNMMPTHLCIVYECDFRARNDKSEVWEVYLAGVDYEDLIRRVYPKANMIEAPDTCFSPIS